MPSSDQLELDIYYLVTSKLILTQLAYADTAYYTQLSCKAELQLRVGGGLVGLVRLLKK